MGGIFINPNRHYHIWRYCWLTNVNARLVYWDNSKRNININVIDIEDHHMQIFLMALHATALHVVYVGYGKFTKFFWVCRSSISRPSLDTTLIPANYLLITSYLCEFTYTYILSQFNYTSTHTKPWRISPLETVAENCINTVLRARTCNMGYQPTAYMRTIPTRAVVIINRLAWRPL